VRNRTLYGAALVILAIVAAASQYAIRVSEPIPWEPEPSALRDIPFTFGNPAPVIQSVPRPVDPVITFPLDAAMVRAGEELFRHEWLQHDPLAARGDGLGPVYNATSCAACHFQNGIGGSGGLPENVTLFDEDRSGQKWDGRRHQGVVHLFATKGRKETLQDIHPGLPSITRPTLEMLVPRATWSDARLLKIPEGIHLSQRNTVALFGAKLIDDIPQAEILANSSPDIDRREFGLVASLLRGRAIYVDAARIGRFGWKAQSASLADIVRSACANELGLGNPGHEQPAPLFNPDAKPNWSDLTDLQCNQLTCFVASLARPEERVPADPLAAKAAATGKALFRTVGCSLCHIPSLGGVEGLYSDLLLHDMGKELEGGGAYSEALESATAREWRTPPLWGVSDSAPYLHDGRAATLEQAILLHGGQGTRSRRHFTVLKPSEQHELVAFLQTLRAPIIDKK
jgi:CxxC motif-containing protein (DUF1111 family)